MRVVVVHSDKGRHYGGLYTENEHVVVILSSVLSKAHTGPLEAIRCQHFEPEADITILPRKHIRSIRALGFTNREPS